MGSGLLQLVSYGAQDIYLTGNPQITFFKIVYRRHTNFAIETIEQTFDGNIGFDNTVSANITRSGDLVSKIYIKIKTPKIDPGNCKFAWIRRLGHAIIKHVSIEIGGCTIDKHYGTWLDIWYELARQGYHNKGYRHMIGDIDCLTDYNNNIKHEHTLFIPLQFWFNRFVGLSIPLIALQYHETNIYLKFEHFDKLIVIEDNNEVCHHHLKDASLLINYIYLDTDERRRFAIVGHEYLIEQLQFNGVERVNHKETRYNLDFNHPTKEIIWATRNGNFSNNKRFIYYTNKKKWSVKKASKIILDKSVTLDENLTKDGCWYKVKSKCSEVVGTFYVINKADCTAYINPESLKIGHYGITDKICADIIIYNDKIDLKNLETSLTIRDLSVSLEYMDDTRCDKNSDVRVNIFSNYGLLINGKHNPVAHALLQFNGYDRFDRREGEYFNYIQPLQHHSNTPKDGINCYSFALYPEEHQPSGTSNLSRIDSSQLTIWFTENSEYGNEHDHECPHLHYYNEHNKLYIFAVNYNIFRIYSGISGISYTTN
jgi:hypothetical protein